MCVPSVSFCANIPSHVVGIVHSRIGFERRRSSYLVFNCQLRLQPAYCDRVSYLLTKQFGPFPPSDGQHKAPCPCQ